MDLAQKYHSKYPKGKIVDLWTGRPDSSYPKEGDMVVKDAGGGISASGSANLRPAGDRDPPIHQFTNCRRTPDLHRGRNQNVCRDEWVFYGARGTLAPSALAAARIVAEREAG